MLVAQAGLEFDTSTHVKADVVILALEKWRQAGSLGLAGQPSCLV